MSNPSHIPTCSPPAYIHPQHLPDDAAPTLVQPIETTVDPSVSSDLRCPKWARRLLPAAWDIARRFNLSGIDALVKRAARISGCMQYPALRLDSTGKPFVSLGRCRDRCCPVCSSFKQRRHGARIAEALATADGVRHIVLNITSVDQPLADQVDRLIGGFRRLRQTKIWRAYQNGAIAAVQVTRNSTTGLWHPHLHILAVGDWMPKAELESAWDKAIGDKTYAWIEPIHSRKSAASYIARYIAAPNELTKWPDDALIEYAEALAGRRTLIAVGCMHASKLPVKDRDEPAGPSRHGCSMRLLAMAVRRKYPPALLLRGWISHHAKWADSMLPDHDEVAFPTGARVREADTETVATWIEDITPEVGHPPPPAVRKPNKPATTPYLDWPD